MQSRRTSRLLESGFGVLLACSLVNRVASDTTDLCQAHTERLRTVSAFQYLAVASQSRFRHGTVTERTPPMTTSCRPPWNE
eukprot:1300759-Rhodomonas_salina.1